MKILEKVANIAIILAVAVFLTLVIRGEFLRRPASAPHPSGTLVGQMFTLPGVHFANQREILVLAISASCHFCSDSLPFYRQLATQVPGRLDVVAVLPQSQAEAETWVNGAGLSGVQVVSAPLGSIGVYATPTLLMVDRNGRIKSEWVGRQDEAGERKILAAVVSAATAVPGS